MLGCSSARSRISAAPSSRTPSTSSWRTRTSRGPASANRSAAFTSERTGPPRRRPLPSTASYIALGHIHKPQKIDGPVPAYYAGSLLQMDFGEAGEEKTFVVVTASPGEPAIRPADIEHVPYEGGLPLVDLRASLAELEETADQYRTGWLRVTVPLTEKDPDLNRKVRELLPNALVVRAELPEAEEQPDIRLETGVPPVGHYARLPSPRAPARSGSGRPGDLSGPLRPGIRGGLSAASRPSHRRGSRVLQGEAGDRLPRARPLRHLGADGSRQVDAAGRDHLCALWRDPPGQHPQTGPR